MASWAAEISAEFAMKMASIAKRKLKTSDLPGMHVLAKKMLTKVDQSLVATIIDEQEEVTCSASALMRVAEGLS